MFNLTHMAPWSIADVNADKRAGCEQAGWTTLVVMMPLCVAHFGEGQVSAPISQRK